MSWRPGEPNEVEPLPRRLLPLILFAVVASASTGCVTVSATLAGPVTGPVSLVRSGSVFPEENPIAWFLVAPFKLVAATGLGPLAGLQLGLTKDWDYLNSGTYRRPGSLRLRHVYQPFRCGFLGPALLEDRVYPVPEVTRPSEVERLDP